MPGTGTLFVVATPIGNLEDITLRALRVLREVAVIAAEDTRRTAHLLARHAIATPTTSLHEHNERQKTPSLVARLVAGEDVALVSDAGTPTISDPGSHLIHEARAAGVRVEPIPGPSAVIAALAASGHPADQFIFLGFPPTRAKDRIHWFNTLRTSGRTVVFFEAPHRIRRTLQDLRTSVGECQVSVARELTKIHEELVNGPISLVLDRLRDERGEFVVVVDVGQKPENIARELPNPTEISDEIGRLIETNRLSRRQAVAVVARRYGLGTNAVYSTLEQVKKSG